jgi:cytochrome c peroxidase
VGINGAVGGINAPTVLNSGLSFKQFWDGRAETLEDQVNGPTHHPMEMGSDWDEIIDKLTRDPAYTSTFATLYRDGITAENIRNAIATFERSLVTANSPFDRFLRGDEHAIDSEQKEGYRLFKDYGCVSCHQGTNVGGNMFQVFGVMSDYFADRGNVGEADLGRFNVTGKETDRHRFKVPTLRNVASTAPYFHDGSAARLEDAVETMAEYQLGRRLSAREINLLVRFLESLSGTITKD